MHPKTKNVETNVLRVLNVDPLAKSNKFTAFSVKFLNIFARFFVRLSRPVQINQTYRNARKIKFYNSLKIFNQLFVIYNFLQNFQLKHI